MTMTALRRLAADHFGAAKGAGFAAALLAEAARSGRFLPERLGASPATAERWRSLVRLSLPEVTAELTEATPHGLVQKRRLQYRDGAAIESVSLPMGRGRTALCVSTQVGCARACTFCETGRLGLRRNLTADEIAAQVTLQWRERPPDTVVFQGMGEPLDNLDGLVGALRVLTDRNAFGLAQDKLTVCTVGHVPGIAALASLGYRRLGLSLSLNAANEALRAELMPHSVRYSLVAIQAALQAFRRRRNLALGVHWCLLPGVNDSARDAAELAAFVAPLGRTFVHLIPYNPGSAPITRAPNQSEIERFAAELRSLGVAVRRRITKGRSLMAACGQLGAPPNALAT